MHLYLLDAPEGSSIGILAIAIMAPESRFDEVLADASRSSNPSSSTRLRSSQDHDVAG